MFQDTLLIIKQDFLVKRKPLLVHLLHRGFLIKGQRTTCFTPELAADFYKNRAEDPGFMFKVILLSKGISEAFILTRECCVEELINVVVCYFGNSIDVEKNVHVTQCPNEVSREITFIFPNYIYEPIYRPEKTKFCSNSRLCEATISALYDIVTNPEKDAHKSWKEKLAHALILENKTLPRVSHQCCHNEHLDKQDMAQQTKLSCLQSEKTHASNFGIPLSGDRRPYCSSLDVTTSSCISCSGFDSRTEDVKYTLEQIVEARTAILTPRMSCSSPARENLSSAETAFIDDPTEMGQDETNFKHAGQQEAEDFTSSYGVESSNVYNEAYKPAIEIMSTKFNTNASDAAEVKKEINKEMFPLSEEVVAAKFEIETSSIEEKTSLKNMAVRDAENVHSGSEFSWEEDKHIKFSDDDENIHMPSVTKDPTLTPNL